MVAEDLTATWQATLQSVARAQGLSEEQLTQLRSKQILRSLAARTAFTKAAVDVARNIAALRQYLRENQRDYAALGRLGERERDRVEEEVGAYVRACSRNISTLQEMVASAPASGSPLKQLPPSSDLLAHRQGMVLILSERLAAATALFDRLRSLRYQQLQQQEASRQRRLPQRAPGGADDGRQVLETTGELHARLQRQQQQQQQAGGGGPPGSQQQQQMQLNSENQALQLELMSTTNQVEQAERTVREIAALNQMFSTAIMHQSEQIEQLYTQAVEATHNISGGNVQLEKAIGTNKAGRKYLLIFFLLASLSLLFLDWFYS